MRLLTVILCCFFMQMGYSQVHDDYIDYHLGDNIERAIMPPIHNSKLLNEELRLRKKGRPDHFAKSIDVNINPELIGTWDYTDQEIAVWRYTIISAGAKSINLGFSEYQMPTNGRMYIYNYDRSDLIGPFTATNNTTHKQLWTPVIEGDKVTIEVQVPTTEVSQLKLQLKHVNHDFVGILKSGSGSSGSCNLDVNCGAEDGFPIVDRYRDIINAVGAYTLNGISQCSGVLVNNARNDCKPYFLTANHCEVNNQNSASVVVYWNYENSSCRLPETVESGMPGDGTFENFTSGSTYISGYAPSDFTLLELNASIDAAFEPYFAGWDNQRALVDSALCIHHPAVEEKRISLDYDSTVFSIDAAQDSFIRIESWNVGTTERGSSGAPLFNMAGEIIGLLNSGQADCVNKSFDDFGPFYLSWEGGGTPETRLKDWLDPDASGIASLSGKNCTFTIDLQNSLVEVCNESTDLQEVEISVSRTFDNAVQLSISELPDNLVASYEKNQLDPGASTILKLENLSGVSPGIYTIMLAADDGLNTSNTNLILKVFDSSSAGLSVIQPIDGSQDLNTNVTFAWETESNAVDLQVSESDDFINLIASADGVENNQIKITDLASASQYFWRIRTLNICGTGDWSEPLGFTTGQIICASNLVQDETVIISDSRSDTVYSVLDVPLEGQVKLITIPSMKGTHTWIGDLSIDLISPAGTIVNLVNFQCDDADDFDLGFSDDVGTNELACPFTDARLYKPTESLSTFIGEEAKGEWRLRIVDIATLDGGELSSWRLELCVDASTEPTFSLGTKEVLYCGGDSLAIDIIIGSGFVGEVKVDFQIFEGRELGSFTLQPGTANKIYLKDISDLDENTYSVTVDASDGNNLATESFNLTVNEIVNPVLQAPMDEAIDVSLAPDFSWEISGGAERTVLQVSDNENFDGVVLDTIINESSFSLEKGVLDELTTYYWRLEVSNECGEITSDVYSFVTEMNVSTFHLDNIRFRLFPNPATDFIVLRTELGNIETTIMSIYDLNGKKIKNQKFSANQEIRMDVSQIPQGIYLVKTMINNSQFTARIFITD